MTTASDFNALITALENNLQTMGVLDASFDSTTGVLGLVARILDIEASVGGIILSTSLSCTAASNSIYEGQSIILSGKLSASYNDTSQTDDDLEGYLKSATIEIYNGQTLLGTCTTDSNGEYLFTHQCNTAGTLNLTAKYEGTDFYDPSTSTSVTVSVNELTIEGISLSSDKSILSAADNEYATLTATLLDGNDDPIPISGETITFEVRKQSDDSLVETLTADTNNSGTAAVCYYGKGTGDLYIQCSSGSIIVSETYTIEDIFYYNPLTEDRGSYDNTSNLSISYSDKGMKILGTKASDVYTKNTDITLPSHYSIEMTVTEFNSSWNTDICVETMFLNNAQNGTIRRFSSMYYDDSKGFGSYSVGTVVKFVYNASTQTLQLYYDGVLKKTMTSLPSNHIQQFKTYTGRYLTVKDLKVREL